MRIAVVGSGPAGMVASMLLARQGHAVTLLDRESGPAGAEPWDKHSVFQFRLPHGFRNPIAELLHERLPEVLADLLACEPVLAAPPGEPVHHSMLGMRREVFDRVLWHAVDREPGVSRLAAVVTGLVSAGDAVTGVLADGRAVPADLVVDASGRGWVSAALRGVPEGGECAFGYVCRRYRLLPGAEAGPLTFPGAFVRQCRGYVTMVFYEDAGHFSVLVVRARADRDLAGLADPAVWDAVLPSLPGAGEWIDPARSVPVDRVRSGTGLTNTYLGQARGIGGLLAVGDAVCITNPMGARGVTLAVQNAAALADVVAGRPPEVWAAELDAWSLTHQRPWFDDQVALDESLLARWRGEPLDPGRALPVDLLVAALQSEADTAPGLGPLLGGYLSMRVSSAALAGFRAQAEQRVRAGWRPVEPDGLTHAELVAAVRDARANLVRAA